MAKAKDGNDADSTYRNAARAERRLLREEDRATRQLERARTRLAKAEEKLNRARDRVAQRQTAVEVAEQEFQAARNARAVGPQPEIEHATAGPEAPSVALESEPMSPMEPEPSGE